MEPDEVIALVKDSGLRGRGGAGFSTGTKWSFIPQGDTGAAAKPHYLVVNADESEPGTCKDIPLMLATPHLLVEGVIIASYAIRASHAFIYVRGEVLPVLRRLQNAVAEAYAAGYLGSDIAGSGYDLELVVHAGAGAYYLRRGDRAARLAGGPARPAPAAAAVPRRGRAVRLPDGDQQRRDHRQRAADHAQRRRLVPVDGQREIAWLHAVFAVRARHQPRPVRGPAGHHVARVARLRRRGARRPPAQVLDARRVVDAAAHRRTPRRATGLRGRGAVGSMLGTKALEIFDETTCVVRAVRRWTEFYKHESCGKCTPCREGTFWLDQIYERLETGKRATEATRQAAGHLRRHLRESRSARWAMVPPAR